MEKMHRIKWFLLLYILFMGFLYCYPLHSTFAWDKKAIVRPDNDFTTDNDLSGTYEIIPEPALKQISILLKNCMSENYFEKDYECGIIVYKVKYSDTISIYIVKFDYEAPSIIRYYLIAYDSKTKKVTKALTHISGKLNDEAEGIPFIGGNMMDNLENGFPPEYRFLKRPFIYFTSNDLFKNKLVVIKSRRHHGTLTDAEIRYFYIINDEMEFKQVLALESKCVILSRGECFITRKFENDNIVSFIQCGSESPKYLGRVQIRYVQNKVKIISSSINEDIEKRFLITSSGVPEEEFLNN